MEKCENDATNFINYVSLLSVMGFNFVYKIPVPVFNIENTR